MSTALEKLDNIQGLERVKKELKTLPIILKKNKDGGCPNTLSFGLVGEHDIGVEIAQILAELLYNNGILLENKFIEVDISKLSFPYIGQTAQYIREVYEKVKGGLICFTHVSEITSQRINQFSMESYDAMTSLMRQNDNETCFVLIDTEEGMKKFLSLNTAFESKICRFFYLKD